MTNKQYLTFRWHDLQYGIEAALVQEIFPLPELIPINEATTDIIGLLNLRGQIIPMINLDLLQWHPIKACHITDNVIVLQWEGLQFGLVVHQANEVLELNAEGINLESFLESIGDINPTFISGFANIEAGNILLLEPNALISQPDALLTVIWDAQIQLDVIEESPISEVKQQLEKALPQPCEEFEASKILSSFYDLYCPNATPEEKAVFRQRADNLRQSSESVNVTTELIPLAVIGFGNEYFGLDLELVRAFTDISNLTVIPCCPSHIVGNMNLRGEIVTLVDIRNVLNLPPTPVSVGSKAVVVQVDDIVAGLPVDQVLEMVELNAADMTPLPATLSNLGEQYLRGTAFFREKILKVLDLPKLFTQGRLAVHEEA
jgi:purine-binding chemotaxis protein CheW